MEVFGFKCLRSLSLKGRNWQEFASLVQGCFEDCFSFPFGFERVHPAHQVLAIEGRKLPEEESSLYLSIPHQAPRFFATESLRFQFAASLIVACMLVAVVCSEGQQLRLVNLQCAPINSK